MTAFNITWDSSPVKTQFEPFNIVCDGVITIDGAKSYRINATANRRAAKPEIELRYMSEAKMGQSVPLALLQSVRREALDSFFDHVAPLRAEYIKAAKERDAAFMAERS